MKGVHDLVNEVYINGTVLVTEIFVQSYVICFVWSVYFMGQRHRHWGKEIR